MSEIQLSVMSFNAANDFIASQDLIGMIERSRSDVVGLVELSTRNAEAVQNATLPDLPHRSVYGQHVDGKGLLSRYPVVAFDRFELARRRSAVDARIRIEEQDIAVFVVHPRPPNYRRREVMSLDAVADMEKLLRRVPNGTPTLLLGDFNFVRGSRGYRMLQRAGFIDTFRAAGSGSGRTYPTRHQHVRLALPRLVRIDFIWASRHFTAVRSRIGASMGSDHRPLYSDLVLKP